MCISCDKSFCGPAKNAGANDKKHEWNTKHTWPEAVGWVNKFFFLRQILSVVMY